MSWQNEVKEYITLSSPNMNLFTAKWRKDPRTTEKKLGIFSIPKFDGDIVQDSGTKSTIYTLTIYFDGWYHHFFANRFMEALKERGQWEVVHPVEGPLILQPIRFQENIDTIDENITEFQTEWIVPANIERFISPDELASSILTTALVLIADAKDMLKQLRADAYALVNSTISTLNKVGGLMDATIQELVATDAIISESYQSAKAAFNSTLSSYGINSESDDIADKTAELAVVPVENVTDFNQGFSSYELLQDDILNDVPETTTEEDFNKIVCLEFTVTLNLAAIAQIVANAEFNSRPEVVSAFEKIFSILSSTINSVETIQDNFSDLRIDQQYFSNTSTYTNLLKTYSLCFQYLITQFYNLKIEKKITLKNYRSPLEITVTEYGTLGKDDENYDLFLESNELTGSEIELLAPGREVVVYV